MLLLQKLVEDEPEQWAPFQATVATAWEQTD